MKIKNMILLVIGSMALTAGALAFGVFISQQDKETDEASTTAVAPAPNREGGGLSVSTNGSTGQLLSDQGSVNGTTSGSSNSNSLPGPENFEIYEEYASEQNALIADVLVGQGDKATQGDTVAVVYQGWLTDGTLFDQSRPNDEGQIEPFVFQLGGNQVIRGWEEGISGMQVGGRRRLVIPAVAGYGEAGQDAIPPNAMLIFDVELVQMQKAERQPGL